MEIIMTEMLWAAVLLVVGFVLLIKGADFFVEGSSSVAKMLKVPSIIIGLTIVAMGTSLPECAVSITASVTNNNALAVSNAIGSNIFNLMVVCGFCALFNPLYVEKSTLKKEFPFSVVCAVLLLVCGYLGMQLGRADGIILFIVFVAFLVWMVRSALKARAAAGDDEYEVLPVWKCIVFIVGGIVAIKFGGDFVVNGASTVAAKLGLSQNLIGLTIVACGTSLPELVTSVVAARKNELDMALGNVIGSNIFNILMILGISTSIHPVALQPSAVYDCIILMIFSILVLFFCWSKKRLARGEGIFMIILYAIYTVYIIMR